MSKTIVNNQETRDQLKEYINRAVYNIEQMDKFKEDQRYLFKEAKNRGFDIKALKQCVKIHFMSDEKRQEYAHEVEVLKFYTEQLEMGF